MCRALLILAVLATPALADKPAKDKDAPPPAPAAEHQEGDYGGVVPGQAHNEPPVRGKGKHLPPKGMLSWIGFEEKDGGAQVFFQSVAPFEVQQQLGNGVLMVYLSGLHSLGPNTWRPIDARYFDTPIAEIVARRVGAARGKHAHPAGIAVRITFKHAKDAKEGELRTATEADGFYYAYLSWAGSGGGEQGGTMTQPEK